METTTEIAWADEAPELTLQVKYLTALDAAAKYWKASDTEVARFEALDGPAIVAAAGTQTFAAHEDRERYYLAFDGPKVTDPALRRLVYDLRMSDIKAHAVAYLIGVPPKYIAGMKKAGEPTATPVEAAA